MISSHDARSHIQTKNRNDTGCQQPVQKCHASSRFVFLRDFHSRPALAVVALATSVGNIGAQPVADPRHRVPAMASNHWTAPLLVSILVILGATRKVYMNWRGKSLQ